MGIHISNFFGISKETLCRFLTAAICMNSVACRQFHARPQKAEKTHQAEYFNRATSIAYPDLEANDQRFLHYEHQPRTVRNQDEEEIWDLSLTECIQIGLHNSRIIRNQAQFTNTFNPVTNSPDSVASVYDPAIQESGVLFGQRGVEAALSDFDTQFTTSMIWGRNELVQNNTLSLGLPAGDVLEQETGAFSMALEKQLATGGSVTVGHNWNYNGSNIGTPPLLFPSAYDGNVQFQFRQPLLAGAGVEYTRIAGPVSDNIQGVSGVSQGVIIARINDDIALADFERNVHQMLHDLETLYWQLHLSYKQYAIQVDARDAALDDWRTIDLQIQGRGGPGGALESELKESYLAQAGRVGQARDAIYSTEAQLRLLMALPVNDGRVIRPIDEPISVEVIPDWAASLTQAFHFRPEIRRQKWNIRSLDYQRRAAENLTMPRLDFISGYQVNGFGDDLFDLGGGAAGGRYSSAYQNLASNSQTGWNLGLQYSVPVGRRYAFAQLRTMELRLAKAQAMLAEQETEISHEIAATFRDVDKNYISMENAYNRVLNARDRLIQTQAQYEVDPTQHSIELVARARASVTECEMQFASSLLQYNTALCDLNFRTGQTLRVNNIHLQEGAWTPDALADADRNYEHRVKAKRGHLRKTIPAPVVGSESSNDFGPPVLQEVAPTPTPASPIPEPSAPEPAPQPEKVQPGFVQLNSPLP